MPSTAYLQAWISAIAMDDAEHAATLLQDPRANGWGPHAIGGTDGSLLVRAAGEGAVKVVRLIKPLSDLNQQDSKGFTALMRAAKEGHVAVIEALLEPLPTGSASAPLNLLVMDQDDEKTALHWAAHGGHLAAIKVLLPHLPSQTLSGTNTLALHDAAVDGSMGVIELLMPSEAVRPQETNHQDAAGWTPIMYAAIYGRTEVVQHLAPLTNLSLRNHEGDSALDLARRRGVAPCVRSLEEHLQAQEAATLRTAMDGEGPVTPSAPRVRL